MQDIASLSFAIDSAQAAVAEERLNKLQASAGQAARQSQTFTLSARDLTTALTGLANQVQANNATFQATSSLLDVMLVKLEQTRAKLDGTTASFGAFAKVQGQVDALGRSFGVTSVTLEQYEQASRKLSMSADQTAISLQRITSALENQTTMGRQIRQVMLEYGVSLQGLGVNDAAKVLEQFTERMRTYRDTTSRYRATEQVLGPISTDTYGRMESPEYVTIQRREEVQRSQEFSARAATTAREAVQMAKAGTRADTAFGDLASQFRIGPRSVLGRAVGLPLSGGLSAFAGRVSDDDVARITRELGSTSDLAIHGPTSQLGQTALMGWLAANPNDPAARGARTWGRWFDDQLKPARVTTTRSDGDQAGPPTAADMARASQSPDVSPGPGSPGGTPSTFDWPGYLAYRRTGGMRADYALYTEQYAQARRQDDGSWAGIPGWVGDNYTLLGKKALALVGKAPAAPPGPGDVRRLSPDDLQNQRETDIGLIGQIGDSGPAQRGAVDMVARGFVGERGDALRAALHRQYGPEIGERRFQTSRAQQPQLGLAMRAPSGMAERGLLDQQWLLSQPIERRGEAAQLAAFARDQGVLNPGTLWASRDGGNGLSLDRILAGGLPSAAGGLSSKELEAFRRQQGLSLLNTDQLETGRTTRNAADQNAIQGVIGQGSGAVTELTVALNAYNAALDANNTKEQAGIISSQARLRLIQNTTTALAKESDAQREQNDAAERRLKAESAAGFDPVARMAAGFRADTEEAQRAAARQAGSAPYTDPGPERDRAQGLRAGAGAQGIVVSTTQNLANQRLLLSVAGERLGVQERMARAIEIEESFAKSLAEAKNSKDTSRVDEIMLAIERTKQLRDETAGVNREAALIKIGKDAEMESAFIRERMNLPPGQRFDFDAHRRRREIEIEYQNAPPGTAPTPGDPGAPRGFRNNNPLNLSYRPGQGANGSDGRFGTYDSMEEGVAASVRQLVLNADRGLNTVAQQIQRWAPPNENNTGQYADRVARDLGVGVNDPINVRDPDTARRMVGSMAREENGRRIDEETIGRGVALGLAGPPSRAADGVNRLQDDRREARLREAEEAQQRLTASTDQLAAALARGDTATVRRIEHQKRMDELTVSSGDRTSGQDERYRRVFSAESNAADLARIGPQSMASQAAIYRGRFVAAGYQSGGTYGGGLAQQTSGIHYDISEQEKLRVDAVQRGSDAEVAAIDRVIVRLKERLALSKTEFDVSRASATQAELAAQREQMQLMQADVGAGMFSWGQGRERAMSRARVTLQEQRNPGDRAGNAAFAQQEEQMLNLRSQLEDINAARAAFQSMGDAAASAFMQASVSGQNFGRIMQGLLATIAQMAVRQFIARPILNMLGSLFSGTGAAGAAGAAGYGGMGGFSAFNIAQGAVFSGGMPTRFASGGVIDRPTNFPMANGGVGQAGEAGAAEGILPLKRLPNGDLGVNSSGGGQGGPQITVNAPITVQAGAAGKDGIDPGSLQNIQKQLSGMMKDVFRVNMDNEMRPGGRLAR